MLRDAAVLVALVPVTLLGCAKARPAANGGACLTWQADIAPLLEDRCSSCHGATAPAGGYRTTSYAGVLGGGSDAVPDAIAGDAGSRLVTTLDPAVADETHRAVADVHPQVRAWVVDCGLSYVESSIHRGGILDPTSADFHGKLLREHGYDFDACGQCHGADFAGGTSEVSCLSCHAEGPTACSTCHANIGASGSHARHLGGGPLGKSYACAECHRVPTAYTDVGHIFLEGGAIDPSPAEVALGAFAALTPAGATRAGAPAYHADTQTCDNVYCHGGTLADVAAATPHPSWSAPGMEKANCGSCHGLPPRHANADTCASCHPSVVNRERAIVAPGLHIDGQVEFADASAGCTGCHGGADGPAPPRDLTGGTATTAAGVGAHQAHLRGTAHLRGPIACNECHRVPADVTAAGHFGGHRPDADVYPGAEVFPADPSVGALAATGGAQPSWDRTSGSCAGVYCHGGGAALARDATAGLERTPVWTAGGLTCGTSCHGVPPTFAPHLASMTRTDCASCHPRTVDPRGDIIVAGPLGVETSAHMNGVLDVAP